MLELGCGGSLLQAGLLFQRLAKSAERLLEPPSIELVTQSQFHDLDPNRVSALSLKAQMSKLIKPVRVNTHK